MTRILMSGAAGFIGSHTCAQLTSEGHEVVAVDNLKSGPDLALQEWRLTQLEMKRRVVFRQADITDPALVFRLMVQFKPSVIIHLAGCNDVGQSFTDPFFGLKDNLLGIANVLESARRTGVKKVIMASSSLVYDGLPAPFLEDAVLPPPRSPLVVSHLAAEGLCHVYHHRYDLDVVILRYVNVYGPASPSYCPITALIRQILADQPTMLWGTGREKQDFVYIDDIVRGTLSAMNLTGCQVINLGSGSPASQEEVLHVIEQYTGRHVKRQTLSDNGTDPRVGWADITKARQLLNWNPGTSLEEGLIGTVSWMQKHWSWMKKLAFTC